MRIPKEPAFIAPRFRLLDVDAGRLERRVSLVGRETKPGVLGFGSLLNPLFVGQQKDVARPTRLDAKLTANVIGYWNRMA